LPVLNNAAVVIFLVSGQDKAGMLKEVLEGNRLGELFPSKLIKPSNGELIWMVDRAAAAQLSGLS
jgi:6-phosphogluconolactonase